MHMCILFADVSGPVFPPAEDDDALIPLPNFKDSSNDECGHLVLDDDNDTDVSDLVPDTTPFYANQEEDPNIQALQFQNEFEI